MARDQAIHSVSWSGIVSRTEIPGGAKWTFDSPRPVIAEIRNVLNCQSGSENGLVATWLWFNVLGPIARYRLGAQAQALETRFQSLPAHFFWHDCQFTQPVVKPCVSHVGLPHSLQYFPRRRSKEERSTGWRIAKAAGTNTRRLERPCPSAGSG